ncbi:MAG: hypothetical protein ABJB11_05630 [Ferruginibacter sp.]
MQLQLKIIGILFIALSLTHIAFPRYFKWKTNLAELSLINKQMMLIHTFFIALTLLLTGMLCYTSTDALIETRLGNRIIFGLFIFTAIRFIIQFAGYSSKLWKGKLFETIIHVLFSFMWAYISIVFFMIFWATKNL